MTLIPFDKRRLLAAKVQPGAYYTDGVNLIEIIAVNESSITWRSCSWPAELMDRCSGVQVFRDLFWLVRDPESEVA